MLRNNVGKTLKKNRLEGGKPSPTHSGTTAAMATLPQPQNGKLDLAHFREILLNKEADLCQQTNAEKQGISIEHNADPLDQVLHASNLDLAVSNLDLKARLLRNVRGALLRLGEGSFGVCLGCNNDISIKRLNAVPWAPLCITCQQVADQKTEENLDTEAEPTTR